MRRLPLPTLSELHPKKIFVSINVLLMSAVLLELEIRRDVQRGTFLVTKIVRMRLFRTFEGRARLPRDVNSLHA